MGISTATGPTFEELVTVMAKSHLWYFDKRLMLAQLSLLSVAVFSIHKGSRIPLEIAKRVLDKEAFEKYPWGRVAFQKLISSIKIIQCKEKCYTLQGPVHVLLTWVYEHVVGIGETYGNRKVKQSEEDPEEFPYLNWLSGRRMINFDEFISKENADHGKNAGAGKHMVDVPLADIFPMLSTGDKIYLLLKNMVEDIISGKLRANAWSEDVKKKKWKVVDDVETSNKKKKMKGNEHVEGTSDNVVDIQRMYKMVENLTRNVEDMKYLMANLAKRVEANERNADQQKEVCSMFSMMKKYFEDFERKAENAQEKEEVQSAKKLVDEATSESPSWMVEVNQTSNNNFPSTRVVKKAKEKKCEKKVEKEKPHVVDKKEVTKKVIVKIEKTDGEKKKKVGVENLKTPSNLVNCLWMVNV